MLYLNATPHPVRISDGDGAFLVLNPHGRPARVRREPVRSGSVEILGREVPLFTASIDGFNGLPEPREGVRLIVSSEVAREGRHFRDDLVSPYIFVRENGQVQGCHALITYV